MQTRISAFVLSVLSLALTAGVAAAGDYDDARAAMLAAYQQADFPAMREAARSAVASRPNYPGALFNLALAQALDDDAAASLATLRKLLSVGVDFGVADIDEFAALKQLPSWNDYATAVQRLYLPTGVAEVAATLDAENFIPEGIALDAQGRFYLGSIRDGTLVRLGDSPKTLSTPANGHWSVFGMRFDGKGGLWFASAAVPQFAEAGQATGRSGLFRYAVDKGEISDIALLPPAADAQVLGDLVLTPCGVIYTTDSLTGAVYRYRTNRGEFETLVERGTFRSPQGLVLDATGQFLYVADYGGGLHRVTLENGAVEKLTIADTLTDYGIDGLYRHGSDLIAIQNGIRPHRVVALTLGADGVSIVAGRTIASGLQQFDEPTLGLVAGDDFYFVANSHWNRFDAQNKLPEGLSTPVILKASLAH